MSHKFEHEIQYLVLHYFNLNVCCTFISRVNKLFPEKKVIRPWVSITINTEIEFYKIDFCVFSGGSKRDFGIIGQSRNQGLDLDRRQEGDGHQHLFLVWTLQTQHATSGNDSTKLSSIVKCYNWICLLSLDCMTRVRPTKLPNFLFLCFPIFALRPYTRDILAHNIAIKR